MYRLLFCSTLYLALGWSAAADQQPPALSVTLHDRAGAPIAGVTVLVRDRAGTHALARATTDPRGIANFEQLAERPVRVAIIGTLLNGTPLYQPGNDAQGIVVLGDRLPARLALRSDLDGMVVPDPALVAAMDPGVAVGT